MAKSDATEIERPNVLESRVAADLYGRSHVRWMVDTGRWQRPLRGVIVTHSGPLSPDEWEQAVLAAHGPHAVLAGLSAAARDGLSGFPTAVTHLLVPPGRATHPIPEVRMHRSTSLGTRDVHPSRVPRRTRIARSIVDAAAWAPNDRYARAVVAAGIQQRLVRADELLHVVAIRRNLRRRSVINEAAMDAGDGSHSGYELDFLKVCRDYSLPLPDRQRTRRDSDGRKRYSDAEFDAYDLVVEIDGSQHMDPQSWWRDMRALNEAHLDGKTIFRYPGFVVRHEPQEVARQIGAFIEQFERRRRSA